MAHWGLILCNAFYICNTITYWTDANENIVLIYCESARLTSQVCPKDAVFGIAHGMHDVLHDSRSAKTRVHKKQVSEPQPHGTEQRTALATEVPSSTAIRAGNAHRRRKWPPGPCIPDFFRTSSTQDSSKKERSTRSTVYRRIREWLGGDVF